MKLNKKRMNISWIIVLLVFTTVLGACGVRNDGAPELTGETVLAAQRLNIQDEDSRALAVNVLKALTVRGGHIFLDEAKLLKKLDVQVVETLVGNLNRHVRANDLALESAADFIHLYETYQGETLGLEVRSEANLSTQGYIDCRGVAAVPPFYGGDRQVEAYAYGDCTVEDVRDFQTFYLTLELEKRISSDFFSSWHTITTSPPYSRQSDAGSTGWHQFNNGVGWVCSGDAYYRAKGVITLEVGSLAANLNIRPSQAAFVSCPR